LALVLIIIILGILLATDAVGPWVLLVIGGIGVIMGVMELRSDPKRTNQNGGVHDE